MPCTTWLHEPKQEPLNNKELEVLLQQVNRYSDNRWLVKEEEKTEGLFKKKIYSYILYYHIEKMEWQTIRFYRERDNSVFNYSVPAELVMAYLIGQFNVLNLSCNKSCEVIDPVKWEKEFDEKYGTEDPQKWTLGIVASAMVHAQTQDVGVDASYITRKLRKLVDKVRYKENTGENEFGETR